MEQILLFTLLCCDTSKYCIFLLGARRNFSGLLVIIEELIHVGYQQSK